MAEKKKNKSGENDVIPFVPNVAICVSKHATDIPFNERMLEKACLKLAEYLTEGCAVEIPHIGILSVRYLSKRNVVSNLDPQNPKRYVAPERPGLWTTIGKELKEKIENQEFLKNVTKSFYKALDRLNEAKGKDDAKEE